MLFYVWGEELAIRMLFYALGEELAISREATNAHRHQPHVFYPSGPSAPKSSAQFKNSFQSLPMSGALLPTKQTNPKILVNFLWHTNDDFQTSKIRQTEVENKLVRVRIAQCFAKLAERSRTNSIFLLIALVWPSGRHRRFSEQFVLA